MIELFELELLGGGPERRWRKQRPDIESLPWGRLDARGLDEQTRIVARASWTTTSCNEFRAAAAMALMTRALVEALAPIDLVAASGRFIADELAHAELCARMAMELGGGTDVRLDPDRLVADADRTCPAIVRATELAVRIFCVSEAVAFVLVRAQRRAVTEPLSRAVLATIVRDEAAHASFGFDVLEWAAPKLDDAAREHLAARARDAIAAVRAEVASPRRNEPAHPAHAFAWRETEACRALTELAIRERVIAPLARYGVLVESS